MYLDKTVHLISPRNENDKINLLYLLALLNSTLLNYFYLYISQETEGRTFSQVKTNYIKQLPIKICDETNQKPFISFVDKILSITKTSDYLENPAKREEVKEYEHQIDQLVYQLYELTPEEIQIVEGF